MTSDHIKNSYPRLCKITWKHLDNVVIPPKFDGSKLDSAITLTTAFNEQLYEVMVVGTRGDGRMFTAWNCKNKASAALLIRHLEKALNEKVFD